MLRLDPWATRGEVWLRPRLPPTIRRLHVAGIRVGDQRITVDVGERVSVAGADGLDVVLGRRPSLSRLLDRSDPSEPPSDL
jgi:hypothetical protein